MMTSLHSASSRNGPMVARLAFSGKRDRDQNAVGRAGQPDVASSLKRPAKARSAGAKGGRLLGAASRAGTAHVMKLWPIGVVRPGEERAEESANTGVGKTV